MRILRGLSSKWLACECLVGVYETYDGGIVTIIDAKGTGCADPSHRAGNSIPQEAVRSDESRTETRAR